MTAIRLDGAAVAVTGAAPGHWPGNGKSLRRQGCSRVHRRPRRAPGEGRCRRRRWNGFALDVRSKESFAAFLTAVDAPLAVLVNNAGIMPAGRFVDEDDAVTEAIIDINVKGVLHGTKLALSGMLERGSGRIVNVASYLGKVPAAGLATYCASKHAVVGFSESLRDELAGTAVTVTAVLPSAVRTDLVSGVQLGGVLPTVDPERIADAVVASCGHRSAIVAVPAWMRGYEAATALVPDRLLGRNPRPAHPRSGAAHPRHHRPHRLRSTGAMWRQRP